MTSVRRRKPKFAPGKAEQTQSFLVIHTGGLGDVVLAAPLLSALKLRFPESQTILLTKAAFCEIALLFPHPPDEIIPLPLNPFQELVPTALLYDKLRELVQLLKGFHFTTVVAADLEPTWLGWFLGSALAPAAAVACARDRKSVV